VDNLDVDWSMISVEAIKQCIGSDRLVCAFPMASEDRYVLCLQEGTKDRRRSLQELAHSSVKSTMVIPTSPLAFDFDALDAAEASAADPKVWTSTPGEKPSLNDLMRLVERGAEFADLATRIVQDYQEKTGSYIALPSYGGMQFEDSL